METLSLYEKQFQVRLAIEYSFTKNQLKVLNKNRNFSPDPGYYNQREIKTDIRNFEMEIKLKVFFELKKGIKINKSNNTLGIYLTSNQNQTENQKRIIPSTHSQKQPITI